MGARGMMMGEVCFHMGSMRTGTGSEKALGIHMVMAIVALVVEEKCSCSKDVNSLARQRSQIAKFIKGHIHDQHKST